MRIIAGSLKGRRLAAPSWEGLRPTSDKLRETLFNILAARIVDARVLDGYAGTGAIGIEALSRGAAEVTFIEQDRRAQTLIEKNLAHCAIAEGYAIIRATVARGLETLREQPAFDIIVLDPPYERLRSVRGAGVPDAAAALGWPAGGKRGEAAPPSASEREPSAKGAGGGAPARRELWGPASSDNDAVTVGVVIAAAADVMAPDGVLILEHARRRRAPETAGRLIRSRDVISGGSVLSFYELCPPSRSNPVRSTR